MKIKKEICNMAFKDTDSIGGNKMTDSKIRKKLPRLRQK